MRYLIQIIMEDDKNPEPVDPDELEKWANTVTTAACKFTGIKGRVRPIQSLPEHQLRE